MFFINFRKKFLRVIGYIFCALLLVLCILMIISAAAFGSHNTVSVFGFNIYTVQVDGIEGAPKGSAVIVHSTTAYDLTEGKLVLYSRDDSMENCTLGYVRNVYVVDGTYYMSLSVDGTTSIEVPETRLVGRAENASIFLGIIIEFIKTPFGIFCIAVLPCIALIVYDIIRAAAKSLPDPEVEPQIKNRSDAERKSPVNISVKSDGKAAYGRAVPEKSASSAGSVLFSYDKPQSRPVPSSNQRPIIPLTNKSESAKTPEVTKKPNAAAIAPADKPKTPESVGIGRYLQTAEAAASDKTTELPKVSKPKASNKDNGDAFFAQTAVPSAVSQRAPQIGKQRPKADSDDDDGKTLSRPSKAAAETPVRGKRSSQILASKRVEDLISDDDDTRDKNRINDNLVDDILSGIKK